MNLMQVFLEAFRAMGIAESALSRGPGTGIDTARFGEDPHGGFFAKGYS
jgi:hypothetical protein